ncbi:hybrid sensor histidine kinase/response regulator [Marinomonas sp. UCMA 3892]|uniref:ATP-binding protein n=1 Tax=Marinomonas sp. UCMA 3892 TaxID=1972585 RepID=UPI00146DA7E3|nr:ATP-binding protein [Marinomonas sp. UCMA 3892]NLU99549.1 hybrid sensor histidine kinase/response regulator [Marinomonas sp. UCMA 3892]
MNNSRYTLGDQQLNDISLKDLARRSRYGGVFYLLAFWAATFSSTTAREHIDIIGVFSGCFLLLQIYRLVLFFKVSSSNDIDISTYFPRYAFIYNLSAIFWVSGSAWLFYINPIVDLAVTINMMAAAGISIGGVTVLAPSYKLMRSYFVLICFPFALAAGLLLNEPGNLIVVGLIIGYGLFIFITGKQQNRVYWQALNDNLKLSVQAEELEKAKVEAERAGQAKADFLAAMTHEIRTPMNGVLGMAQLLAMGDLNEKQKQQVTVINNAGRTLMHIINNILDYSKINAEQLALEKIPFDTRNVVNEVKLLLAPQFEKKPITLKSSIENIPSFVLGDPFRLHQILYNLVGNAFKFTEKGEISIEVSSKESDAENTVILSFSVKDTGIGISPEDQKQIFEQFYQVSHFDPNIRGTGLGLSITQRLVELMGGTISLISEIGVGSRFTVDIPFVLATEVEGQKLSIPMENIAVQSNIESDLCILLAEDNKVNQMICEQFFLKLGGSVDLAETGVMALEKFNGTKKYDVIFMDCNMPEMDGFSTTVAIRRIEKERGLKQIPIVALTAHVEEKIKRQCLDSGMNAFISKPFLFEDIEAMVNKVRSRELL